MPASPPLPSAKTGKLCQFPATRFSTHVGNPACSQIEGETRAYADVLHGCRDLKLCGTSAYAQNLGGCRGGDLGPRHHSRLGENCRSTGQEE